MDLSDSKVRRRVNKAFRERDVEAKVCSGCCVVKGYSAFSPNVQGMGGCASRCKSCMAVAHRERYAANPERARIASRNWRAANQEAAAASCRRWHADNRDARADSARKWRSENPSKMAAAKLRWSRENPDANRQNARRWRAANPGKSRMLDQRKRAMKKAATVEPFTARDLRNDWEDHDLYACFFCGGSLADGYDVEHFYALSQGGPHALFNLVPSCAPCNRGVDGKHSREPWQFLRESLAEQGTDLDAAIAGLEAIAARRRRR